MTFSVVARSDDGRQWGVAVASKFLAVGAVVPAARAGVGAIATQAYANPSFKGRGLALLADGHDADTTLEHLLVEDVGAPHRQAGVVDRHGNAATFTGDGCFDWAGGFHGPGLAIQGNILTGPEVVDTMHEAWRAGDPIAPLATRLLETLRAGDAAGGDSRGRQSAALLVVEAAGGYAGLDDVRADLRVDDHPDPCSELARLLELHDLFFGVPSDDDRLPIDDTLRTVLEDLAQRAGRADFEAWVGAENFENRVWPDAVDRRVLEILRTQANER